jgi:hypothetical protein
MCTVGFEPEIHCGPAVRRAAACSAWRADTTCGSATGFETGALVTARTGVQPRFGTALVDVRVMRIIVWNKWVWG